MSSEATGLVLVVLIAAAVITIWAMISAAKKRQRQLRLKQMQEEAEQFFRRILSDGLVAKISVNIVLQEGEIPIRQESSKLYEARAYRVYGGGGTRIRGIYVGGGASESHQRLKEIDSGSLVLTNQRLIFDGGLENRTLKLKDIVSVESWSDAIEVSSSRRQKSQVYSVENPIIWSQLVRMAASGQINVKVQ